MPDPSTAGQTVEISGRLLGPHRGHRVVRLWRRFPGRKRFAATEITRTDRFGRYSIEDDFLGSQRLDPATDGRPDPRPDVRENSPLLGDLTADFDFSQPPRPPLLLPVCPTTDLTPTPSC